MRIASTVLFAALAGCAYQPGAVTVGGDYRATHFQNKSQHVEVTVYGDRTLVKSDALQLSFYDKDTTPIEAEALNGYYLFPTLMETFYMRVDINNNYLIVQLDEARRIYNIGKVKTEKEAAI